MFMRLLYRNFKATAGRPFRVATPGAYSDSCKAKALPYGAYRAARNVCFPKTNRLLFFQSFPHRCYYGISLFIRLVLVKDTTCFNQSSIN